MESWITSQLNCARNNERNEMATVSGGMCRVTADGVLGVNVGPNPQLPTLALTIGPAPRSATMHANMAKFTGPGTYANEVITVYLGKTALEDAYLGLGTV